MGKLQQTNSKGDISVTKHDSAGHFSVQFWHMQSSAAQQPLIDTNAVVGIIILLIAGGAITYI